VLLFDTYNGQWQDMRICAILISCMCHLWLKLRQLTSTLSVLRESVSTPPPLTNESKNAQAVKLARNVRTSIGLIVTSGYLNGTRSSKAAHDSSCSATPAFLVRVSHWNRLASMASRP